MKKRIVMLIGAGAVAVAAVAGGTQAGAHEARPAAGIQLEWGTGAQPRYVAANVVSASQHVYGRGPLHRLRWGTGGPPELVPLHTD